MLAITVFCACQFETFPEHDFDHNHYFTIYFWKTKQSSVSSLNLKIKKKFWTVDNSDAFEILLQRAKKINVLAIWSSLLVIKHVPFIVLG